MTYKIVIPKELLANIYVKLNAWSSAARGHRHSGAEGSRDIPTQTAAKIYGHTNTVTSVADLGT